MSNFDTTVLDQKRTGTLIANLSSITRITSAQQYNYSDAEARLELLEAYWKTFVEQDLLLQREAVARADSPYFKEDIHNQVLSHYLQAKAWFRERLRHDVPRRTPAEGEGLASHGGSQSSQAAFERVRLPRFNGRRRDWESFKEKFSSLVVDDASMAPIIKLQHLMNCLEGEAAEKLRGIKQSAGNFRTAWETLCKRYDNSYLRFKTQMQLLARIPAANEESEAHLSRALNIVNESINVFSNLKRPVEYWDDILVYFLESKLPPETRKDWAKEVERKDLPEFPTFDNLKEFLNARLNTLDVYALEEDEEALRDSDSVSNAKVEKYHKQGKKSFVQRKVRHAAVNVTTKGKVQGKPAAHCTFCKGDHFLSYCSEFTRCSQEEKKTHVATEGLCYNCLRAGHRQSTCTSKNRCLVCGECHHTKLHGYAATTLPAKGSTTPEETSAHTVSTYSTHQASSGTNGILLSTACIILQGESGSRMTVRALLDSGAEESFVSERVLKALNLTKEVAHVVVAGVGGTPTAVSKTRVHAIIKSDYNPDFCLGFSALVLSRLTTALPRDVVTLPPWPELRELKLADPGLCQPRRIDCILNSAVYAAILQPGLKRSPCESLVAAQSVFGWVLMGATRGTPSRKEGVTAYHVSVDHQLSDAVKRFWEIEEIPGKTLFSPEEQECYAHFRRTQRRTEDGRFVVRLPFIRPPVLADTRHIAERCLSRIERRLQRDPALEAAYTAFMSEYATLDHLEMVPEAEMHCKRSVYYLPHHPVWKADGSDKIRVVFNASQSDGQGNSLNTFLPTGPKLQEDVLIIMMRWAFHRVVFTCDIVKMFRQFRLDPADRDWQRILWRFEKDGLVRTYRLSTVTYGTGCAPFLANACLLQLAEDEQERCPRAAHILRKERYVDDFFTGADAIEEAILLRNELTEVLNTAGLQLGKWASNEKELLTENEGIAKVGVLKDEPNTVSALGLCWLPSEDAFCFKIKSEVTNDVITKRTILSTIARLYDPIGWLAPFIIRPKILLQDLWMRGIDWDTSVPPDLRQIWENFQNQLPQLESIRIPRWFDTTSSSKWQLHEFCDASERAYAAALYIVVRQDQGAVSHLMTAKSKVAPLKVVSLPRLELCGAGLLASLIDYLLPAMANQPEGIHCWTDSSVALAWLSSHPSRWTTFVANRVSFIHDKLPKATWRHVRSGDNPADLATRGLTPEQLDNAEIWWKGPVWLCQSEDEWPKEIHIASKTNLEERRVRAHCLTGIIDDDEFSRWCERFSSFQKIVRIIAYILRWKLNSLVKEEDRRKVWFTAHELELGRRVIFKKVQEEVYGPEVRSYREKGEILQTSSICRLSPFLDQYGVLRVGGRLQNSYLPESEKHPLILPAKHHITILVIIEAHRATLHGGPSLVQSFLLRRFWIVRGRNVIRSVVRKCIICTRMRAATLEQQMGPLPTVRTQPARPFSSTGVDYAGPFFIKSSPGRGQKGYKGYVAIFICMVVRAVHLVVVSDYTTSAFLAALRRFAGRRGNPKVMYSDNATNFKGAEAELRKLFHEASAMGHEIAAELARDGIEWKHTPPRAPNFGGLWEANVKAFKHHFKRVVGEVKLTFEELSTLTTSIEACLNSRPIGIQSQCEEDVAALTPGHFLIGAAMTAPPEPFENINEEFTVCSRWQRVVLMRNHFWKRWQGECLAQMQQKAKWLQTSRHFKVNDIVLFKDELMPPAKWPLARIVKLYSGSDGLHRVAVIRTAFAEYKRPINKLILLPVNEIVND